MIDPDAALARSRVIVTTSRAPSPRTRSFVKDLVSVTPGGLKVNRGHLTLDELAVLAVEQGADRVVIVGERRGNPSIIRVYTPRGRPPRLVNIVTFIVKGVGLSREVGRPQPSTPQTLYVDPQHESVYDFSDAFITAFHARLLVSGRKPGGRDIIARIRPLNADSGIALIEYEQGGRLVGPRIKVARPLRMVKEGERESGS